MNIKKKRQGWEITLEQEAKDGNEEAQVSLHWMKRNRWLRFQRHLKPRPFLQGMKPKIEA